jgi:Tol biopolymer transport system component/S1-C subfamily serine protease
MLKRNDLLVLMLLALIALAIAGGVYVFLLVRDGSPSLRSVAAASAIASPSTTTLSQAPTPTATPAPTETSTLTPSPTPTPTPQPTAQPTSSPIPVQPGVRDVGRAAAAALVKIAVRADSENNRTGSGSIVDGEKGLILTNWHIVVDEWGALLNEEGDAGILWAADPDQGAELAYMARVLPEHSDPDLDLAILQITHRVEGTETVPVQWPLDLPAVTLGDSDGLLPGDRVLLLGYPDYGEGSMSWTEGLVTLRDSEWIRSNALISHGHSGGMMLDGAGRLIGILSEVQWIGWKGELALARPANLALPLIQGALDQIEPPSGPAPPLFRVPEGDLMVVLGTDGVVLRDGPGPDHQELGSLSLGSTVEVLTDPQRNGERFWYHVQPLNGSLPGWATDDYLVSLETALRPIMFSLNQAGSEDLYVVLPDGSELTQVTHRPGDERSASWSPDGDYVVFADRVHGQADLYAMYANGGRPLQLTDHQADDIQPAWSPDGRRIAFVSDRDGDPEIYLLNLYTEELQQVTANQVPDGFPTWSPDGRRLAFASSRAGNDDLFLIDLATLQETQLTTSPSADTHPAWSPNGTEIAYTFSVSEGGTVRSQIAVLDLQDPAHPRQLTTAGPDQASNRYPDWSPDGRWIVFLSEDDAGIALSLVPARGGPPVKLAEFPGISDAAPAWSR